VNRWTTDVRSDAGVFSELAEWWNSCPGPSASPFLRSDWFELWAEAFLPPRSSLQVAVWKLDGEPVAALPLSKARFRLSSLANAHSEVFDIVAMPQPDLSGVVHGWLDRRPVVRLFRLPDSSLLVPREPDPTWLVDRSAQSPFIDLSDGMAGVEAGLSRSFRKDLRRTLRRIEEVGEVVYTETADRDLADALSRCWELEAAGWKGETGTAVNLQPAARWFYDAVAELASDHGWLRLCALLVGDRLAAFEFDLDYAGRRFTLKAGYDESLRRLSPGKVLQWRAVEGAVASGLQSYELGGEAEQWKLDWTSRVRDRVNALRFGRGGVPGIVGASIRRYAVRRGAPTGDDRP